MCSQNREGPEALRPITTEPHRWSIKPMTIAALAWLERLDVMRAKKIHDLSDAGV